jgi:hypothetical protein
MVARIRQAADRLCAVCQNSAPQVPRLWTGFLAPGAVFFAVGAAAFCRADTLTLRTGGLVRGRVLDATAALGHRPASRAEREQAAGLVAISTLTGGRLIVRTSDVATIAKRSFVLEEFDMRKRHVDNDVESQWKLAEWCKSRGLRGQREEVLRQILVLDPDNLQAHQGLGQTKRDGQWRTYDEEMRSRGFVKFEGRYVAQQEVEILKKLHQRKRVDQDWLDRVRSAVRSLSSNDPERRRRGTDALLKISDPEAIPALNKILLPNKDPGLRELYVHVVAAIPDVSTTPYLVDVSLFDTEKSVRVAAQEAILEHPRSTAAELYAKQLRNADNEIVRRSGLMLEKLGDPSVIPQLIDALVTTHGIPTQVVDNSNTYGFNRGVGGPTGGLPPDFYAKALAGQYPNGVQVVAPPGVMMPGPPVKTVMVNHEYRNAEILSALQSMTKQSFGFDKDAWRRWWAAKQTMGPFKTSSTQ